MLRHGTRGPLAPGGPTDLMDVPVSVHVAPQYVQEWLTYKLLCQHVHSINRKIYSRPPTLRPPPPPPLPYCWSANPEEVAPSL